MLPPAWTASDHPAIGPRAPDPRYRPLVVGRVERGHKFRQLALFERLSTTDAARMAFRPALKRLSVVMPDA